LNIPGTDGFETYPLMNNYGYPELELIRGEGLSVYDDSGREYLDFTAGIAVCNLGHAHAGVTEAVVRQAGTLIHTSNLFRSSLREDLARRLLKLSELDKVFFCNSGTEANEAALKLARRHAWSQGEQTRTKLLSLPNSFHGRTYGALSVTDKPAYHEGFTPLLPDCVCPQSVEAVLDAIDQETAACVVEVIQGEGGVRPVDADLLQAIEQRLHDVGALLIVDEIQTGVGRTGTFFAYEQAGLHPDIVTMAKGLANGIPIGAVLATATVAEAFSPGSHGTTFGGNLLAMAAATVVIDTVSQPEFLKRVREVGEYFGQQLTTVAKDVSGCGLMWGMTVENAGEYVRQARDKGVLLTAAGGQRVRFVPPLIVSERDIDTVLARLF